MGKVEHMGVQRGALSAPSSAVFKLNSLIYLIT